MYCQKHPLDDMQGRWKKIQSFYKICSRNMTEIKARRND